MPGAFMAFRWELARWVSDAASVGGVLPHGGGTVCWLLYGFSRGMDAMIALGVWLRGRRIT